jgi:2-oxoisovalerate dehydrogenase E1 component
MAEGSDYINIAIEPMVPDGGLDSYADAIRTALLIRRTEQRLLQLFSEGKLFGTVHTCIGQEFVGVAVARALQDHDAVFSNHRGHGHYLARFGDVDGLIGEVMGKACGVCAGRGGSQHLQRDTYFSNGIQGGIVPVTAGLALASKCRGTGAIATCFIGDGTLGQGALYETMNIASKWDLPLLIVCENNLFAQSTSQTETLAGDIAARAEAFGIETAHSNTWQWTTLLDEMAATVDKVRSTSRPMFHQVDTFRLMAHSKGDDNRPRDYVELYESRDPLNAMIEAWGEDPRWKEMSDEVDVMVEAAVAKAEASPFDDLDLSSPQPVSPTWEPLHFDRARVVQSISGALGEALASRDDVFILGEDIESPYGGAFKATMGLSLEHPDRVRNTPISELSIAGIGNGLALGGMIPVVEFMFGDFTMLAADQWVNHASKFRFMFNDKVRMPVIYRTPMGGKRGYASTHSQSLEKHLLGLPDTQVLCLHHRYCPSQLYTDLFATIDIPTLVIENKILYGKYATAEPLPGFSLLKQSGVRFPVVRLKPDVAADITMVVIGGLSLDAEEAIVRLFEEEEVAVDLFMPTQLYPFDVGVLSESLETSGRLLVVEEGQGFVSLASEILAQVAERHGQSGIVCRRLNAEPVPIPAARPLEEQCLPGIDDIVARTMEVMNAPGQ